MKTVGLIGGMSWESTVPYYRIINQMVGEQLGGLHSAPLLLYSLDFHEIERFQAGARWAEAGSLLARAALTLQQAGADFIVLCTNTMHKVTPSIEAAIEIPLLHIVDTTAEAVVASGIERVGLLGTRFTMDDGFYRERLEYAHGLTVLIPPSDERTTIHRIIYEELCLGRIHEPSRSVLIESVRGLIALGAQGVILGCTEIGMLLHAGHAPVPLFDSTRIHARRAAQEVLGTSAPG